jgi:hypothetical protein
MIHWIAGRKTGVEVVKIEVENEAGPGRCWGHLPSRDGHEAGDSRADCEGVMVHEEQRKVVENGSGEGETRRRWNANSWIGIASDSP